MSKAKLVFTMTSPRYFFFFWGLCWSYRNYDWGKLVEVAVAPRGTPGAAVLQWARSARWQMPRGVSPRRARPCRWLRGGDTHVQLLAAAVVTHV